MVLNNGEKMIITLITARGGSKNPPQKNVRKVLGKPLVAYPLSVAKDSKHVENIFLSTDSKEIANIGKEYGAEIIPRPKELARDESKHEDAILHGFQWIKKNIKGNHDEDIIIIMCGNCATITTKTVDKAIEILKKDKNLDSCSVVAKINDNNPSRAYKVNKDGVLYTMFKHLVSDSDRDSIGQIYTHVGVWIVRARCLQKDYPLGEFPYRWIGSKSYPLIQDYGWDVDNELDFFKLRWWLKKYGKK
jgi:CMP-N-acetylneuraminic acid synthetase